MKYLIISILLVGCSDRPDPLPVETKKANDYNVSLLFTHDDCKVYRFEDKNHYRYFTNCSETMTEQSFKVGKATYYISDNNKTTHGVKNGERD